MKEPLFATDAKEMWTPQEPMTATEVLPGDPAHVYNDAPDPAFSDEPLNKAVVETVGKMHDLQGLAQPLGPDSGWDHNSGDLTFIGPVDRPSHPQGESTGGAFGSGYGKVS